VATNGTLWKRSVALGVCGLALAFAASSCAGDLTGPTPPPPAPTPPVGPITVSFSGTVFEKTASGKRPLAGATVAWCDVNGCGRGEPAVSGDDGRYAFTAEDAAGSVYVIADRTGFKTARSHPAATVFTSGPASADLELWPAVNRVSAVVFEVTPDGVQPIAGANVMQCDGWFEDCWEQTTGPDGRADFDFGESSGGPLWFWISKDGFEPRSMTITVVGTVEMNVELIRKSEAGSASPSR
jgi:hypothetical protein